METTETSTVAAVKPALNPKAVLAIVAAGVVTAGVIAGVVKWKKYKAKQSGGYEPVLDN